LSFDEYFQTTTTTTTTTIIIIIMTMMMMRMIKAYIFVGHFHSAIQS
jgi:hypothetical protein